MVGNGMFSLLLVNARLEQLGMERSVLNLKSAEEDNTSMKPINVFALQVHI